MRALLKPVPVGLALFALGLSAWSAVIGPPVRAADPATVACSSCDARHQSAARVRALLAEEPTP